LFSEAGGELVGMVEPRRSNMLMIDGDNSDFIAIAALLLEYNI
jgi:hypothetical protein